jgi:tetratricopeptide (TPR) repeat protein
MTKTKPSQQKRTGQRPSSKALRNSILWPVLISGAIWVAGLIIWLVAPGRFDVLVSALIAAGLLIYLAHFLRQHSFTRNEKLFGLVLAIPAILGITYGMVQGNALYAITGVSFSLLLLLIQRVLTVPISYRMARRRFMAGDLDTSLDLVNRAINARPSFWESYQLRALIHLSDMRFGPAERDARQALLLRPDAHPVYNTLGQLYLADTRYSDALDAYLKALELSEQPLYRFYAGLAEFRLERFRAAAEAFADAIRGNLPSVTFELQAYYYFGVALEILGETEKSEEVFEDMVKFKEGLAPLKEQLSVQPDFPHLPLLQRDLRDLEARLVSAEEAMARAAARQK